MNDLIKNIVESKFNFNIDIEDSEKLNSLSKSKYNSVSQKQLYIDLCIVDLDLPSKTIWCKYNLGVDINLLDTAEDWFGNYYAWGEIKPKDLYTLENYKFGFKIKYNKKDKLKLLLLEDDAAYLNNIYLDNYKFRIPSKMLFHELLRYTNNELVENYNNINGLNGNIFKSKTNNNELFIPVTGFCYNSKLSNVDNVACLWTSSLNIDYPNFACNCYFRFGSGLIRLYCSDRYIGMSIRPVLLKS